MSEAVICLDSGIWIKYLTDEEPADLNEAATHLVIRTLTSSRIVAPAFAWAEIGSTLRKKVRQHQLLMQEAERLWTRCGQLEIEFVDNPALRNRAWEIAEQYNLPTLYDAAYLACTELSPASASATREFWTTDLALVRSLGTDRPAYLRVLGVDV